MKPNLRRVRMVTAATIGRGRSWSAVRNWHRSHGSAGLLGDHVRSDRVGKKIGLFGICGRMATRWPPPPEQAPTTDHGPPTPAGLLLLGRRLRRGEPAGPRPAAKLALWPCAGVFLTLLRDFLRSTVEIL